MPNRIRSVDQAAHAGRRLISDLGDDLREARLRAGVSQRDVAAATGVSQTKVARTEGGRLLEVSVLDVARHAGAVGLRLHAKLYPAGPPIRDQAQVALLDRFRKRLSPIWRIRLEAPLPGDRDLRAWDMLVWRGREAAGTPGVSLGVEAITRLRDVQAQVRAAQLKRRDASVTRLVLLVAATHANRRALAAAEPLLRSDFTVGTRAALACLAMGTDPGGDALILL